MIILPLAMFTVVSCGGGGDSTPAVPSAPTGVTASAGDNSVSIGWSAVAGATSYKIYYSTTTGVPKATATEIAGVTTNPKIVTGLNNGTTYFFVVTAVDAMGESAYSSQVSAVPTLAPPAAPTGITATAGDGEATIGWDIVAGATSYNIYYSTTEGFNKATANRFTGVSPYIATGLVNGTTYYFAVTAVNGAGEGPESSEVSARPRIAPPAAPTGVTATAGAGEAIVNWAAVTGATSYNIYYSTTPGVTKTTGTKVAGVSSPKTVTPLTYGTTWYFVVTVANAGGESADSSQVSAIPFVEYVAFGDSITFGDEDDLPADNTSMDGRNTGGGFEPVLNNLLTSATGIAHSIVNEGWGGYNSSNGLSVLTTTVLGNHPNATYYLILFGTNDANPNINTPSGLGLNPGDSGYSGSYKENMQRMIDAIETAGKIPYLAKVPYTLDAARTAAILEYNQVIDELVVANGIPVTPPDFYGWFQANQGQLADSLHPNGAGYQSMANLWRNALVTP